MAPRYGKLYYDIRRDLQLTWTEYVYLDMVHNLSNGRWCTKSLAEIGLDLGLDRANVYRLRNRLIHRGLVIKNAKGHVRSSVMYAKRLQQLADCSQNATPRSQNAYAGVVKTQPKITYRYTEDNKGLPEWKRQQLQAQAHLKAIDPNGRL
jgi:predicted transcriptional regulator